MRVSTALAGMILGIAFALPAHALNQRTWVSGKGIDQDGCGVVANPCRTLQFAHDQTQAGGEIDVLDSAGYGTVKINKSISIVNDGVGVAGLFSNQGIAIDIENDVWISVLLRGLTIDGGGSNTAAVAFVANGRLSIQNCLIKDSGGVSVFTDAPSSIQILNSTFLRNIQSIAVDQSGSGQASAPVRVLIDRTTVTNSDLNAIRLSKSGSNQISFVISNSTISSNDVGIWIGAGVGGVVSNSTITQNRDGISGISVGPSVSLTGNTIFGNINIGVDSTAGIRTFGDNKITGNGTDVYGYLTPISSR